MKKLVHIALIATALALSTTDAEAAGGPRGKVFGLGLQLGVPLGITGNVFLGDFVALAFGAGAIFPYSGVGGWFDVHFYFLHINNKREDVLKLYLYAGPGVQVGAAGPYYYSVYNPPGPAGPIYGYGGGPFSLAVRAPFGFAIHWQKVTFDTYVEVAPALYVLPGVFFAGEGAIGARYYF